MCAGIIGKHDALHPCEKQMRQYGALSTASVDSVLAVLGKELEECELTTATS